MFDTIGRFFGRSADIPSIEAKDADKSEFKTHLKANMAVYAVAAIFNSVLVVGSGSHFRMKLLGAGVSALCLRAASLSERFRFEALGENGQDTWASKSSLQALSSFSSKGFGWSSNILTGFSLAVAVEKKFGTNLAAVFKVVTDKYTSGNVVPSLAVGMCGLSLAALVDYDGKALARVLRIVSMAQVIHGIFPKTLGPIAEVVVSFPSGFSDNAQAAYYLSVIGVSALAYLSADDRKSAHTEATSV